DFPAAHSQAEAPRDILLSSGFACTTCDLSFESPTPQLFSFNSPQGMCPACDGLGSSLDFDPALLITEPTKSFLYPCIGALRTKPGRWARHIYQGVADMIGFDLKTPWNKLSNAARDALLYGTGEQHVTFTWRGRRGEWKHGGTFEGVVADLRTRYKKTTSQMVRDFYEQFMRKGRCANCKGDRLIPQALAITLTAALGEGANPALRPLNIAEVCRLPINEALQYFENIQLQGVGALIAAEPLKEIRARLQFLLDVGLDYLTLDRSAPTLSGGESQRIRLASQIGSGLVGVLYVLDEPSIGLHPRDNQRLLKSLQTLRDAGNTVVVVEHDRDTMEIADFIVDFGPGAGVRGGEIVASGNVADLERAPHSITGAYLSGARSIEGPQKRRPVTRPDATASKKKKSAKS
ncbi:MAG: excinuclease ABC subunit A, partial [Phycisphaerae bacterium]